MKKTDFRLSLVAACAVAASTGCTPQSPESSDASSDTSTSTVTASVDKQAFGTTEDGEAVDIYTLVNANGLKAKVTTYVVPCSRRGRVLVAWRRSRLGATVRRLLRLRPADLPRILRNRFSGPSAKP